MPPVSEMHMFDPLLALFANGEYDNEHGIDTWSNILSCFCATLKPLSAQLLLVKTFKACLDQRTGVEKLKKMALLSNLCKISAGGEPTVIIPQTSKARCSCILILEDGSRRKFDVPTEKEQVYALFLCPNSQLRKYMNEYLVSLILYFRDKLSAQPPTMDVTGYNVSNILHGWEDNLEGKIARESHKDRSEAKSSSRGKGKRKAGSSPAGQYAVSFELAGIHC